MDRIDKELFAAIRKDKSISATEMAKDLSRGIFWVLAEAEDEVLPENIFAIQKYCTPDGIITEDAEFTSRDGQTYNHEATWSKLPKSITRGKPYNYYPRGRVEIANGKATIWMNGNILGLADEVKRIYGLGSLSSIRVKEDGSSHYKCHFDD